MWLAGGPIEQPLVGVQGEQPDLLCEQLHDESAIVGGWWELANSSGLLHSLPVQVSGKDRVGAT